MIIIKRHPNIVTQLLENNASCVGKLYCGKKIKLTLKTASPGHVQR